MMSATDLVALRSQLGLTQLSMAKKIGLSLRAFQNLESGKARLRPLHERAIERAIISYAIYMNDPELLGPLESELTSLAVLVVRHNMEQNNNYGSETTGDALFEVNSKQFDTHLKTFTEQNRLKAA